MLENKVIKLRKYNVVPYGQTPDSFMSWMDSIEHEIEYIYAFSSKNEEPFNKIVLDAKKLNNYVSKLKVDSPNLTNMISSELERLTSSLDLIITNTPSLLTTKEGTKTGRRPLPSSFAKLLLLGIELSIKECGNEDLFRTYYANAATKDFNLNTRKELGKLQTGLLDDSLIDVKKYLNFSLPVHKDAEGKDTDWLKKLKQTLKRAINRNTSFF